jgi:hypothetical protein
MSTVGGAIAAGVAAGGGIVNIPFGAAITAGRETSQVDGNGTVQQGMVFGIKLPDGTTTSVFIPYSQITNTSYVEGLIGQRVAAIQAITG